jgi:hypothetical protein
MWLAIPDPQQADVTPEQYAAALAELEELQDPGCSVWDQGVRAYTQQHQQLRQQQEVLQALQQRLLPHPQLGEVPCASPSSAPAPDGCPADVPFDLLGAEQQAAIVQVEQLLQSCQAHPAGSAAAAGPCPKPQMFVLSGGPGTGKSTTTKTLVSRLQAAGYNVLLTATTASAAERLGLPGTDTIDAVMYLLPGKSLQCFHKDNPKLLALIAADVIICDEFSMLDQHKLYEVLYRLKSASTPGGRPKLLVLVGDPAQLPPVCHCKHDPDHCNICRNCHLMFSPVFQAAAKFNLQTCYRQAEDQRLLDILNIIRSRQPSQVRSTYGLTPLDTGTNDLFCNMVNRILMIGL